MSNGYDKDADPQDVELVVESKVDLDSLVVGLCDRLSREELIKFIESVDAFKCDMEFTVDLLESLLLSLYDDSEPDETVKDIEQVFKNVMTKIDIERM